MAKDFNELATEITVAWIQAHQVGGGAPVHVHNLLTSEDVAQFYKTIRRALKEAAQEGSQGYPIGVSRA